MSEELLQTEAHPIGRFRYYRLGASTLRQLREAGILNASVPAKLSAKKPDGLIVVPGGRTLAVIEYKPPGKLRTDKQIESAIKQELQVANALCKLLNVTSGSKTFWINALNGKRVMGADGTPLSFVVDAKAILSGDFDSERFESLLGAIDASLTSNHNTITPPHVIDPSLLANTIWQKIWVQTGKSPEKCLYNVVELFVFKFLTDIGVLNPNNGFESVEQHVVRQDSDAALKHYARICRKDVQDLFPEGNDGTSIINGTIFVNEEGEPNLSQASLFASIVKDLCDFDRDVGFVSAHSA